MALAISLVLADPVQAQAETSTGRLLLSVGSVKTISLRVNPSTGYRWQLAAGESAILATVRITDAGFSQGKSSDWPAIGAPGSQQWRIEGRKPVNARAVFVYARPWEHVAPSRRHVLTIEVTRK